MLQETVVKASKRKIPPKEAAKTTQPQGSIADWADNKNTLYLVDISSFIFRAFYAVRHLSTRSGEPTNAIYGVCQMFSRLASEARPEHLAVVYDSREPNFRKEIYPEYKANRSPAPDDLVPQFARIEQLIESFNIKTYREPGNEADDVIATLTSKWTKENPSHKVVIISSDKDLMQLVGPQVCMWDTMKNRIFHPAEVIEKFGVRPDQVRDYLALVGDSSDNIPGVPSIGPKGASQLLVDFENLEGVLQAAKEGKIKGKKGQVLVEHEDKARISADLASMRSELPHDPVQDNLDFSFVMTQKTADFFRELEFETLLNRWPQTDGVVPKKQTAEHRHQFHTVTTEAQLEELILLLKKLKIFAVDLETTSLNPREAKIVGIALSFDQESGYYIPVGHTGQGSDQQLDASLVLEKLKPFLEDPRYKKIGQNLKYDWSVFWTHGIRPDGIGADTMIASYVLQPSGRHNLNDLAKQFLDYDMVKFADVCGKGKDQITFDEVPVDLATRYAAEDALIANQLWKMFEPLIQKEHLMEVFATIDMPLIEVLGEMERDGVHIDVPFLEKLSKEFESELVDIDQKIHAFTKEPLNINSPKQLAKFLFEDLGLPTQKKTKGKSGYSTDAKVLEKLADLHEVPRLILEHREIAKLKGTYIDPLPLLRERDGKIHTSFHQAVAATGRLSCSDPNLQNIPIRTKRGRLIRRAFVASPGNLLISADYSQIELRVLAHMSDDAELIRSFQADEDIHLQTASEIFDITPEAVTEQQRGYAKAINFGLMYGKTAFGLSQELKIPRNKAQKMIDRYFVRYSGVKSFLDRQIVDCKENGYVATLLGRKRFLPEIKSANFLVRQNAERMAMNSPVQGTAADMMKIAMTRLFHALKEQKFAARLTVQVHDEVLLDCPQGEVDAVRALVVKTMSEAMKMRVPLKVNTEVGLNWMEL